MSKEYECEDCNAVFSVDNIEEGDESPHPQFCPYCGSDSIVSEDDEELDDDEDELFDEDDD